MECRDCGQNRTAAYQIQVEGLIGDRWAGWIDEMAVRREQRADGSPITTLTGTVDQAALRGILIKLWDLNLNLVSVDRIEPGLDGQGETKDE